MLNISAVYFMWNPEICQDALPCGQDDLVLSWQHSSNLKENLLNCLLLVSSNLRFGRSASEGCAASPANAAAAAAALAPKRFCIPPLRLCVKKFDSNWAILCTAAAPLNSFSEFVVWSFGKLGSSLVEALLFGSK